MYSQPSWSIEEWRETVCERKRRLYLSLSLEQQQQEQRQLSPGTRDFLYGQSTSPYSRDRKELVKEMKKRKSKRLLVVGLPLLLSFLFFFRLSPVFPCSKRRRPFSSCVEIALGMQLRQEKEERRQGGSPFSLGMQIDAIGFLSLVLLIPPSWESLHGHVFYSYVSLVGTRKA